MLRTSSTRKVDVNEGANERAGRELRLELRLLQAAEELLALIKAAAG